MANVIYDEKRFVNVGEVCAINLKDVHPVLIDIDYNFEDPAAFFGSKDSVSSDDDITFIKYLGNGFFMDLVSDQLLMSEIHSGNDLGTEAFNSLNTNYQDELTKISEYCDIITNPTNIKEFNDSASIFIENPLVIDIATAPFMSINSNVVTKFASQSLEQVKSKIVTSKLQARQDLQQQYNNLEGKITEYYNSDEMSSSPKTM